MKKNSRNLPIFLAILLGSSALHAATYLELFPNSTGSNATSTTVGWAAYSDATAINRSTDTGQYPVSFNLGIGSVAGYYAKTSTGTVGLAFTTEAGNDTLSNLTTLSFYNNNSNVGDVLRFALRIDTLGTLANTADDIWVATSSTYSRGGGSGAPSNFPTNGLLQSFNFSLTAATWRDLTFTAGTSLALGAVRTTNLTSSWTMTATGFYNASNVGTLRLDNFSVTTVPEPSAALLLISSMGTLALFRRRRPA